MLYDLSLWFWRARLAVYRFVATLGAGASAFLALWLQAPNNSWRFRIFLLDQILLILVGSTPTQYARVQLLESMLPSIWRALELRDGDRITIHHLRSGRRERYEQLTDYYPTRIGRGRVYGFAHGIVGQCFKVPSSPHSYSIPPGADFATEMKRRWNFTDDELARLTQDRRSFFTIAIGREGQFARAVFFMDSADPERFSETREAEIVDRIELFVPLLEEIVRK